MRPIERTAFTLDEAAVSSAIGREQLEEWIYSGELPAFKVGCLLYTSDAADEL